MIILYGMLISLTHLPVTHIQSIHSLIHSLSWFSSLTHTNGIRANLPPSTVQFEDEPGRSWWECNTPIESHQNERDPEVVHVWDYTIEDDLKELIGTTYTNKMHILFDSPSLKNFIVKRVCLEVVMGWVTF